MADDFQSHIRAAVLALYKAPQAERGRMLRQAIDGLEEIADNYPDEDDDPLDEDEALMRFGIDRSILLPKD